MKLMRAELQGYRTFAEPTVFEFGDGMNALVGRNNCGKSNLLSAITLAMEPDDGAFDRVRDTPAQMQWSVPRIVLEFYVHGRSSPEKTLLQYAQDYEEALGAAPNRTYADAGKLRLVVEYRSGIRQEYFQAASAGARRPKTDDERLEKLLTQFRRTTRYVLVRSGESLESLLNGRFRDILQLVLRDHLRPDIAAAEAVRGQYVEGLQRSLLKPLQDRVSGIVTDVFPEIVSTSLVPHVPDLDKTLAEMHIELEDKAKTDLRLKGTGVRGGVLLALLRYLADQSRRSIIFAVEEPEAFLHPGAQEELRDELEKLAERDDITLLVTTHSPFTVSRDTKARVIALRKDLDGKTRIRAVTEGSTTFAAAVSDLFRDPGLADVLTEASDLSLDGYRAILVVEGETDEQYLRLAARRTGREHILDGMRVVPAHGAQKAVVQAILLRHRSEVPLLVMLDHDELGRVCMDRLKSLAGFTSKREILSVRPFASFPNLPEAEAEDLWPEKLLARFVKEQGEAAVLEEKKRVPRSESFRYGFSGQGKEIIGEWLERHATYSDCDHWASLLDELDARVTKMTEQQTVTT